MILSIKDAKHLSLKFPTHCQSLLLFGGQKTIKAIKPQRTTHITHATLTHKNPVHLDTLNNLFPTLIQPHTNHRQLWMREVIGRNLLHINAYELAAKDFFPDGG